MQRGAQTYNRGPPGGAAEAARAGTWRAPGEAS